MRYFSYSEDGMEYHDTAVKAKAAAQEVIDFYLGDACDGWNEAVTQVCWGRVTEDARMCNERPRTSEHLNVDPDILVICDVKLFPVGSDVINDGE